MKKYILLLFLSISSFSFWAQNKETKAADKLFESYDYGEAAKAYLSLVEKGNTEGYVAKQLAESYYYMHNTVAAEQWYAKAIATKQDAETYYKFAQSLKSNGKYMQADAQMKTFAGLVPDDQRAKLFLKNPNYLAELLKKEKLFVVEKLSINSQRSDFGANLYDDILYFASARNESNKIYGWNNEPYLDIYQSTYNANGTYSEPVPVTELNTKFHEGPVSLTNDGTVAYFSGESFNDKLFVRDKTHKLKFGQVSLYKATKENGKWGSVTPLPFNSKSYSMGNPAIDKEGKTLYFASNMPGSIGGTDIWKVAVNGDGTYGIPENLGDKINTAADENFPFVTEDAVLYFSSNGLLGFGSLDVFSVNLTTNEEPANLGKPVNTEKDDFAFTFNTDKKIGFLSSNRDGIDHIYSSVPVCKAQIAAIVKDVKTGSLLANSRVLVLDEAKLVLETKTTTSDGEVNFNVECKKRYTIEVLKDGYITKSFPIAAIDEGKVSIDASIEPIEVIVIETEIILNPIYFEFNKSEITVSGAAELDKLVYVMSQNDKLKIFVKSHTDSRGSEEFNLELSEKRAKATVDYIISKGIAADKISGKGFGILDFKIDCQENCTDEQHGLNRRSEFMIVK